MRGKLRYMMNLKNMAISQLAPPLLVKSWAKARSILRAKTRKTQKGQRATREGEQDLDLYWDPAMAEMLETWGKDHVWNELQMFLVDARGKVLDIACGTGVMMEILEQYPHLEVRGCDISDFLIGKAVDRGIASDSLEICDATKMDVYPDASFDYAYSIGSLEHFTEDGIAAVLSESARIAKKISYHMMPVSRSGKNEGWISPHQSYFNNSVDWWLQHLGVSFEQVRVINSGWNDVQSLGKWFVCMR